MTGWVAPQQFPLGLPPPNLTASAVLTGRRVVLAPMTLDSIPGLMAAAAESRASYGYTHVPDDEPAMHAYVTGALADQAAGTSLPFTVLDAENGRVLGSTRFLDLDYWAAGPAVPAGTGRNPPDGSPTVGEIGSTWLCASAQRTGANIEAKLLLLTHAFETWNLLRVSLKTHAGNERSRRSIEALGAVFEGVRRAHVLGVDGTPRDSAYYSIVRAEWPDVRAGLRARLNRHANH